MYSYVEKHHVCVCPVVAYNGSILPRGGAAFSRFGRLALHTCGYTFGGDSQLSRDCSSNPLGAAMSKLVSAGCAVSTATARFA